MAAALAVSCNEPAEEQPADVYRSSQTVETPTQQPPEPAANITDTQPGEAGETAEGTETENGAAGEAGEIPEVGEDTVMPGADVYLSAKCATCHGGEREGGSMAPALVGLTGNWDTTTLEQYLTDPEAYAANDPRLNAMASQYSLKMPAWQGSAADRAALIDWLLAD